MEKEKKIKKKVKRYIDSDRRTMPMRYLAKKLKFLILALQQYAQYLLKVTIL